MRIKTQVLTHEGRELRSRLQHPASAAAFLEDPAARRYGYDLMKAVGLKSGTLYPVLSRLEHEKLVTSGWEAPRHQGERPRKYYWLTGEGIRVARLELAAGNRLRFLLTASLVYGGIRLARPAVRRLPGHRTGRK